ncbi:hypothetical protein FM104_00335 [Microbacterium esteraromaticum]|uniref:Uncharacterized protein n=1 Tax=Microbacterium esteraromaticum TaxID=57043 RepID=A0A1R4I878_9MICO|nr:hypothetical protein [Microbacterium esteraromaticum]SJN15513.1 hypothetical protein FM104_00335 [Microbacterium esteraromaticum]
MPTFDNPVEDATEASTALRGLAHATRTFDDPAETYPVLGELLAGVRSLRQVLDQLAAAHIGGRSRAHDDAGNQTAGATAALAAADELHQAGTLLDAVHDRVDQAMSHSGRIAWHPAPEPLDGGVRATVQAGTLTLTVWPDTPLGEHQRYAYSIHDTAAGQTVEGRDLFTGTGAPVSPERALRELAVFLSAAGEARQYAIDYPGQHTDNEGAFPDWVADAARQDPGAFAALVDHDPQTSAGGRRWISVVFLQGEDADRVLDVIDRDGTETAIKDLAGYDFGDETVQAALENGYVYDEPPSGPLDRVAVKDTYALTYNPFLGHVSLLRAHDAVPDEGLLGIDTTALARSVERTAPARAAGAGATDWFARRPGASASSGRGVAL